LPLPEGYYQFLTRDFSHVNAHDARRQSDGALAGPPRGCRGPAPPDAAQESEAQAIEVCAFLGHFFAGVRDLWLRHAGRGNARRVQRAGPASEVNERKA
jgi:hypothetical protein